MLLEKLRVKVVVQKSLKEGLPVDLVYQKLCEDPYFHKIETKLGKKYSEMAISNFLVKLGIDDR